jgi:hypothetical protein
LEVISGRRERERDRTQTREVREEEMDGREVKGGVRRGGIFKDLYAWKSNGWFKMSFGR